MQQHIGNRAVSKIIVMRDALQSPTEEEDALGMKGRAEDEARVAAYSVFHERELTDEEKAHARRIFHNRVDYDAITITAGHWISTGASRTIGNTIHLEHELLSEDGYHLSPTGLSVLVHEIGHVWQFQNHGLTYLPSALLAMLEAEIQKGDWQDAYDWREAHSQGIPWYNWNAEQQAEAIQHFNDCLTRFESNTATTDDLADLATLEEYMELVRMGVVGYFLAPRVRLPRGNQI